MESIDKMKVADLKRELKARNLSIVGNKPELAQRLLEYISLHPSEEKGLLTGLPDEDVAEDSILDNEDAVLGIKPVVISQNHVTKITMPSTFVEATLPLLSSFPLKIPKDSKSPEKQLPSSTCVPGAACSPEKRSSDADDESLAKKVRFGDGPLPPSERTKKFQLSVPELSEEERKRIRSEKFGLQSNASNGAASTEVLKKRTERFGISAAAVSASPDAKDEQKKQRMERFSATTVVNPELLEKKFVKTVSENEEQLRKRAQRFGLSSAVDNKSQNPSSDDALLGRKIRFDVDKTTSTATDKAKANRLQRFAASTKK